VSTFAERIRTRREALAAKDARYGLRKVASRVGISATYLSLLERGKCEPPSERVIEALAQELGENLDALLALAGRISSRLVEIIVRDPEGFAAAIESLGQLSAPARKRAVREIRDGDW